VGPPPPTALAVVHIAIALLLLPPTMVVATVIVAADPGRHLAYPNSSLLLEIFAPNPTEARSIAKSGAVVPLG
jgi:hypothetical protein